MLSRIPRVLQDLIYENATIKVEVQKLLLEFYLNPILETQSACCYYCINDKPISKNFQIWILIYFNMDPFSTYIVIVSRGHLKKHSLFRRRVKKGVKKIFVHPGLYYSKYFSLESISRRYCGEYRVLLEF